MKNAYLLLLLVGLVFVQCSGDDDDGGPSADCQELQSVLNLATADMLTTFSAYTKDTQNPVLCENYKNALQARIKAAQDMIDAKCLSPGVKATTEQAIMEDQDSIDRLNC